MTFVLTDVGFTYRGDDAPALTGISLELADGTMTAVLGAVGSGTSTLCRLLAGQLTSRGTATGTVDPGGTVALLGDDPEAQLSGMTSYLGDEAQLACRLHGRDPADAQARARHMLERLGIAGLWARRVDTLSGGQRQLVALARLLAADPDLLILDQPAQSLDPAMRIRLAAVLQEFCARGGTVLITGHQIDELTQACEPVHLLDSGRLRPTTDTTQSIGIWDCLPAAATAVEHASINRPDPRLTVAGLRVDRGSRRILDGLDLDLRPGELVTVTGDNGVGKSTLLRGMIGLLDRSARMTGTIAVSRLGEMTRVDALPAHARSTHLGWVGQDPGLQLSAATVADELLHASPLPAHRWRDRGRVRDQRRSDVDTVLAEVELTEVADEHPFDLDAPRRKDVVIASALMTGSPVLLLDEPTIGRDLAGMNRLNAIIERFLGRGGAVLATTHDRRWASEAAHRSLQLANGRLQS
ncbi:ATP-binding cassette domain-containing protein [Brevibacterium spongiae]|uniref:Energy-coupling factor ABC transporter ATP-binding protein n=1 Tax=Brevibacterium spongiae TaxID=2909672 RepID=A0ABY5SSH6_9MICO|nr:ABC transporter ATP-binding protein [Brevibacterium spongiae]UVI37502.1 energy-coupling factor ABC transporter ATP-binding protein [Brevibacterium spongiae]